MVTVAAMLLAVLGWTPLSASTATAADQDVMVLSSWAPVLDAGAIAGGSQTVTVTNVGAEAVSATTFDTARRPCECAVTGLTLSRGTLLRGTWSVRNLVPGETATMSVLYRAHHSDLRSSPSDIPSTAGRFPLQVRSTALRTHRAL